MEVHFIIYARGLVQLLFLAELLEVGLGHERVSKARLMREARLYRVLNDIPRLINLFGIPAGLEIGQSRVIGC